MGLMLGLLVILLLVGGLTAVVVSVAAGRSKTAVNRDDVADLREKLAKLNEDVERLREEVTLLKRQEGNSARSTAFKEE